MAVSEKRVLAVMLNYCNPEMTIECIKSLVQQVDTVCIVDNSEKESEYSALLKGLKRSGIEVNNGDVIILNPGVNLGFSKGINYAVREMKKRRPSDAILVINNDVKASNNLVSKMLDCLGNARWNAVITANNTFESPPSLAWYHKYFSLLLKHPFPGAFRYMCGACLMLPVSLVHENLFDEEFFMYGEDVDLSWRMSCAGVPLVVADAEYAHIGTGSSEKGGYFYEFHLVRAHMLLAKKLANDKFDYLVLVMFRLLLLPLRAVVRSIRYKSSTPFKALVAALRDTI